MIVLIIFLNIIIIFFSVLLKSANDCRKLPEPILKLLFDHFLLVAALYELSQTLQKQPSIFLNSVVIYKKKNKTRCDMDMVDGWINSSDQTPQTTTVKYANLQVDHKLLGGGEGGELSSWSDADPWYSCTGAPPQSQNAMLSIDGYQSLGHPLKGRGATHDEESVESCYWDSISSVWSYHVTWCVYWCPTAMEEVDWLCRWVFTCQWRNSEFTFLHGYR